jgi:uncharacterized membrane protein
MTGESSTQRSRPWYRPTSVARSIAVRPRVYWGFAAAITTLAIAPATTSSNLRVLIAWDAFAIVYLALAFRVMMASSSEVLRRRAARQDDSRVVIFVTLLLAIAASFWAIAAVLSEATQANGKILHVSLGVASICLSWIVTQVVFTFHYAHEYYTPDEGGERLREGLDFRDTEQPDYWDFFYFATSFGAASQTSDVTIRTKALRRLATLHAVISFFFNAAVLALAVNIGAGLMSTSIPAQ